MAFFRDQATVSQRELQQLVPVIGRSSLAVLLLPPTHLALQGEHHILSSSFTFQFRGEDGTPRFIVVENEWRDAPSAHHYGKMRIRSVDHPPSWELIEERGTPAQNKLTMRPFQAVPVVQQIDIFERTVASSGNSGPSYEGEHVCYDAALVFRREDHSAFRLSPEAGPLGRVEFCQLWSDIRQISSTLKRRVMITENGIDLDPPPA